MFAPKTSKNGRFTVQETTNIVTVTDNKMSIKKEMIFNTNSIVIIKYNVNNNVISQNSKKRTRRMLRLY